MEAAQSSKETRVFPRRLHNRAPPSRVTSRGYCGLEEMCIQLPRCADGMVFSLGQSTSKCCVLLVPLRIDFSIQFAHG